MPGVTRRTSPSFGPQELMKNFIRLVKHAWPYRVRFGLSLGCAAMVAILWGANISAVYPLLNILFYSKNCQGWVAEQIDGLDRELAAVEARSEVLERFASDPEAITLLTREWERRVAQEQDVLGAIDDTDQQSEVLDRTGQLRRELEILNKPLQGKSASERIDELRSTIEKKRDDAQWWRGVYLKAQPLVNRYLPDDGFRTMLLLLCVVMFGVMLKGMFLFCQEVLVASITQLTLFNIRNHFYRRTMALDLGSFNAQRSSELMARFTNDMDSFSQGLNTLLGKVIREPLRAISCLSVAMFINWRLTLLALILVPVSAFMTRYVGRLMKRAVRRSLESMSQLYKILQESFQGIKVVKAFGMERYERRRFFRETKALYRKSVRVAKINALSDPILEVLSLSAVSIALLSGSYLVLRGTTFVDLGLFKLTLASEPMAIEDLLSIYAMLAGITDPVRKLANVHSKIQRAAAASDRICAMMDREPVVVDRPQAPALPRHVASIEFDAVRFGYPGREPIIDDLTLRVACGETIALVGPNGCGKSTLMSLLPRFWDIQDGVIRIDGHDLRDVRSKSLRDQIGMVTQEVILFEDTVARNIAYGHERIAHERIEDAARAAHAHDFIMQLPEGYETHLSENGQSLSGGQRQRIALARVMLRDPRILILDEATSAVDIEDEELIRQTISRFARNRTTFIITHSLNMLQAADRIALMNYGRIEAIGTHHELMATSDLYQKLHRIQLRESA